MKKYSLLALRVALGAVLVSIALAAFAIASHGDVRAEGLQVQLAQAPTPVPMPPDAVGPLVDWVKLFGYIQVAGFGLAFLGRILPHDMVNNQLIPRFKYGLFFLTNVLVGLTALGKEAGWVTYATHDGIALAGLGLGGLLKSAVLAVVQTGVNMGAWDYVLKKVVPPWILNLGKAVVASQPK